MKALHEVVHHDEISQGVVGLRHRKLRALGDLVPFLAKFVFFVVFRQF